MSAIQGKCERFSPQVREGLKTTLMGLGLMRLQMDIGQLEEARKTLATLKIDYQHLIFDNPVVFRNNGPQQHDSGQGEQFAEWNESCLVI